VGPQEIEDRVKQVVAGLFAMDAAQVGSNSSIETIERWDSLQHVNLMMSLEQEFGVQFEMEEAAEMTSFDAICQTLRKYLAGSGP